MDKLKKIKMVESYFDDYSRIIEKLNKLKSLDSRFKTFGAKRHKYLLNNCLTEEYIRNFEENHKISLPEEYRNFLKRVGNGGAGPSYGLLPLERFYYLGELAIRLYKNYNKEGFTLSEIDPNFLSKPFPYTSDWENMIDDEADILDSKDENINTFNYDIQGTIALCDHGCGLFNILVVSGAERGKVWFEFRIEGHGMGRVSDSFINWYEGWLDRSIKEIEEFRNSRDIFSAIVEQIIGQGYARTININLNTKCNTITFYYIEHDEFLKKGQNSNIILPGNKLTLSLYMKTIDDFVVVTEPSCSIFEQTEIEPSNCRIVGEIRKVFNKHCFSCFVTPLSKEVLVTIEKDIEVSTGDVIDLKGRLEAEIFKVTSMVNGEQEK